MEITKSDTRMKVGSLVEVRVIHLWGVTLYAVVEGTKVRYFDTLAGALNCATDELNVHPQNRLELLDFLRK
jgi:hypothetical protein